MKRPEFIYFDLGNVLVHFDHAQSVRQVARLANASESDVRQAIFESGLEDRYESGLVSSQEFAASIEKALDCKLDTAEVLMAASDMFWENSGILTVLRPLQMSGIRLGLLSNTCEAHWNWIENRQYATVVGWFEHHVLSYEVKSMKPSPAIYEHATELAAVPPESIFFVDDRMENVQGAIAAGWKSIQYTDNAALLKVMEDWN